MSDILEIDGEYLEGGGQILRNALSLSCILQKPVRIFNIRAKRPNPGLSHQHLHGINLLQRITDATVRGNELGSKLVEFHPKEIRSGNYFVDTKTAASITLIMQSALPVLIYGSKTSKLEIIGGTNVAMAPQVDEMTEILRPILETVGVSFDFDLHKRGYYPKGGGKCTVHIQAVKEIKSFNMTTLGELKEICGWAFVAGRLPFRIAEDMKYFAEKELNILGPVRIEAYKESRDVATDNGSGIILKASTTSGCILGSSELGSRAVDAKILAESASKSLQKILSERICVDDHIQDQIILYMALAEGKSEILTGQLTNHTKAAIHVAQLITQATFTIKEVADGKVLISCIGIGKKNSFIFKY